MGEKQGYEVLKLVAHGEKCYMSTDYIRGKSLIRYLRYRPQMEKERLYRWIRELITQLDQFHRCRGNPSYQYVNPYSVIVGEDENLYLLDLGSREQEEILHLMQRRYVREKFLSPENQYYQKASMREDIYGAGKTIQYLLSAVETAPALTGWEEFRLRRTISRCLDQDSKRTYQTFSELSEHLPRQKSSEARKLPRLRRMVVVLAVILGIAALGFGAARAAGYMRQGGGTGLSDRSDTGDSQDEDAADHSQEIQRLEEKWDSEKQALEEKYQQRERELSCRLAAVYFADLEDYGRCSEALDGIGHPDQFVKDFAELSAFMDGKRPSATEYGIKKILERMEEEAPDGEDERYTLCIARGYQVLEKGE